MYVLQVQPCCYKHIMWKGHAAVSYCFSLHLFGNLLFSWLSLLPCVKPIVESPELPSSIQKTLLASAHHSPSLLLKLSSMPSLHPDSITATVFFTAHHPKSSINSNTYRTLLLACSLTPAPVNTSPLSSRSSTGSLSHNTPAIAGPSFLQLSDFTTSSAPSRPHSHQDF